MPRCLGVFGFAICGEGGRQEDSISNLAQHWTHPNLPSWQSSDRSQLTLLKLRSSLGSFPWQDGPAKTLEKLQREAKKRWKAEEGASARIFRRHMRWFAVGVIRLVIELCNREHGNLKGMSESCQ